MLKIKFIIIVLLSISLQVLPQNKPPIIVNENIFQQNYRQDNGMLFCDSSNGFLVRWEDFRYGTPTYFAQEFDRNSQEVNDKFLIKNYQSIVYLSNNKLFGLYRETYAFSLPSWDKRGVQYFGEYFNKDEILGESVYLGGGDYPWCGTGWPGEGTSVSRFNDELLIASDFGGTLILKKIFADGSDSLLIPELQNENEFGYSVFTAYNLKGEGLVAYFGRESYDSVAGIWIQSYSLNNELISKCFVKEVSSELFNRGIRLNLTVASVNDSLFQLLYIDSLKLKSVIINIRGEIKKDDEYEILLKNDYPEGFLYDDNLILASNFNNGSRAIFIQVLEYLGKFSNSLYYFNSEGNLINAPLYDSSFTYLLSNQIFKDEDDNLISTTKINDKIYLIEFKDFNIIDTTLISNEPASSNEANTRITKYKDEQFFVSYSNEVKTAGRFISMDGNPVSEEKEIDSQSLLFFSDGSALKIWSEEEANYKATKGFSILDCEFNIIRSDTLVLNYDSYYGFCKAEISSDDSFIIVYQNISGVFATKYDKQGNEIKTVKLSEDNRSSVNTLIFFDGQKTFVYWHSYIHLFNEDFEIESVSEKVVYGLFAYLGDDKFATSLYEPQEKRSFYSVVSSNGDTLLSDIAMIYREIDDPMIMGTVKNDEFILFYLEGNKLFANTYNSNGVLIIDKFIVHEAENEVIQNITFSVNGNKVMFGWSAKQKGEYDFDINCVSYDIDLLTNVEESQSLNIVTEYSLKQNYPNPFNPSTTIKYSIPTSVGKGHASSVRLSIYDVLGREVVTLINEQQPSGNYEVIFNASNLSSGIYYYQLKSGDFIKTKKMVLLR